MVITPGSDWSILAIPVRSRVGPDVLDDLLAFYEELNIFATCSFVYLYFGHGTCFPRFSRILPPLQLHRSVLGSLHTPQH